MINNTILKYNANVDRIQTIFKSIKYMGINMSEFENALSEITNEVNLRISNLGTIEYTQKDSVNYIYQYGIDKTNDLLHDLEKYNEYYQAINKCYYIQGTQDNIELNNEKLDIVIDDVMTLLKTISEFDGLAENNDNMIENLFDFVYTLIKAELCSNGSSRLLSYCKNNEVDSYYINKSMFKEIEGLKEGKEDISKIESQLSKNVSLNITSSVIDEELMQIISLLKSKDKYSEELLDSLSSIIRELDLVESKLRKVTYKKNDLLESIDSAKENYLSVKHRNSKLFIKNTVPFALTAMAILGMHFGITRLARGTDYNTVMETFSSQTGETVTTEEYIPRIETTNDVTADKAVIIDVKSPWEKIDATDNSGATFGRVVDRTILYGVDYDDLKDYINLDLETYDGYYEQSQYLDTSSTLENNDKYTGNITEVTGQRQDLNDSKVGNEIDLGGIILINFFLIIVDALLLFMIEVISSDLEFEDGFVTKLFKARRNLRNLRYNKFNAKEWMEKIALVDNEIRTIIQESYDAKTKCQQLINNPKYKILIDEYESKTSLIGNYLERIEKNANLSLSKKM